eukprot:TRINITY_DN3711_c0_g1_i1.p1 TRINITY_DN3711_c0_g1~~TRINITY_DN3711_c0_g1_i1.p1  ORF type:complete len:408 (-),score=106.69 TRINITY_DN3711_c0_g1_i1:33-1235(-)
MKTKISMIVMMVVGVYSWNNGVARTPPMGWNSWNHFGCGPDVREQLFMEMADAMVSSGMAEAGYEFIDIDDCWPAPTRDPHGRLQPDPIKFPSGMIALSDYIHSKGLKFGIYEDSGNETCGGYEGSYGSYAEDAATFAEWGVDLLKLDGCYSDPSDMKYLYTLMSESLFEAGRPVVFSCSWPAYAFDLNQTFPWEYIGTICHMWRYYDDIRANYESILGILDYTENQTDFLTNSGISHWNDPDMLEVGNGNLTYEESKTHFSLWAVMAAPLIAGNDLRNMTSDTLSILTNKEVIAVDQDPLGIQGHRIYQSEDKAAEIWTRPLYDGGLAVIFFNRGDNDDNIITGNWSLFGWQEEEKVKARDLWLHEDLGDHKKHFKANPPSHGVTMIKFTPSSSSSSLY